MKTLVILLSLIITAVSPFFANAYDYRNKKDRVGSYLAEDIAIKVKVGENTYANGTINGYRMFSRGPLAKVGNEKMPYVLFRILPEVAQELERKSVFGTADNAFGNFGFFYDNRPGHTDWPTPYGFTWGVPSETAEQKDRISYVVRTCAGCHTSRIYVNDKIKLIVGAANREIDQHRMLHAMNKFISHNFSQQNRAQTKDVILKFLNAKDPSWFYKNEKSYDEKGRLVQFDTIKAKEQIELFKINIDDILTEMYNTNLGKTVVLEAMNEQYNSSPSTQKQAADFGPPGILDSNSLGILSIMVAYNRHSKDPFALDKLFRGATKVKIPSVWNQNKRTVFQMDGNVKDIYFRDTVAALGFVDSPVNINGMHLEVVSHFIGGLPSPEYEFNTDSTLAKRGRQVFENARCTSCHVSDQKELSELPKIYQVGTSKNRAAGQGAERPLQIASSTVLASCKNPTNAQMSIEINGHRTTPCQSADPANVFIPRLTEATQGYVAIPLNGIWARAPYLHNGSVPTLWHLFAKRGSQSLRPSSFLLGALDYDSTHAGWKWKLNGNETLESIKTRHPAISAYDTSLDGFSMRGHEGLNNEGTWRDDTTGIHYKMSWDVADSNENADLLALIEYLKTL